jgi:hypothetical protein
MCESMIVLTPNARLADEAFSGTAAGDVGPRHGKNSA